jgi:PTH1 family peptidyl-tRNA hydrolase
MTKSKIELPNVLVVCDDINLDFGKIRLRSKGSDGGHNGLGSIIEHLGTQNFARLRLGVSAPPFGKDAVDYVLEKFSNTEKKNLEDFIERASNCCLVWLNQGIQKAMEEYNER